MLKELLVMVWNLILLAIAFIVLVTAGLVVMLPPMLYLFRVLGLN